KVFAGMDSETLHEIQHNAEFRVLADELQPFPSTLRPIQLRSPQGYDPLITTKYQKLIEAWARFQTDRLFTFPPTDEAALQQLGVKYVITHEGSPNYLALSSNSRFRAMNHDVPYLVFEYLDAVPSWGWERVDSGAQATVTRWEPERRSFRVKSGQGGRFTL